MPFVAAVSLLDSTFATVVRRVSAPVVVDRPTSLRVTAEPPSLAGTERGYGADLQHFKQPSHGNPEPCPLHRDLPGTHACRGGAARRFTLQCRDGRRGSETKQSTRWRGPPPRDGGAAVRRAVRLPVKQSARSCRIDAGWSNHVGCRRSPVPEREHRCGRLVRPAEGPPLVAKRLDAAAVRRTRVEQRHDRIADRSG